MNNLDEVAYLFKYLNIHIWINNSTSSVTEEDK